MALDLGSAIPPEWVLFPRRRFQINCFGFVSSNCATHSLMHWCCLMLWVGPKSSSTLIQKCIGAAASMVYYSRTHGKCRVCQHCKPGTWFRCVICGVWMGMHCNPRQVPLATGFDDAKDESRFDPFEVSLHCYIWTSEVKLRSKRADLCLTCCINMILNRIFANVLPILVQRTVLRYVSWGSWWWRSESCFSCSSFFFCFPNQS